jgi:hypothetical protein
MASLLFAGTIVILGVFANGTFGQAAPAEPPPAAANLKPSPAGPANPPGLPPAARDCSSPGCCPARAADCCASDETAFWVRADYLLWWMRQGHYPPLVTHGEPNDTPSGAIGQRGTRVLFGDGLVGPHAFSGGRLTVGAWLDGERTWGVDSSLLFLAERSVRFQAASNGAAGTGTLAVPFFNADGNFEDADQVAIEGQQAGPSPSAPPTASGVRRSTCAPTSARATPAAPPCWPASATSSWRRAST